MTLSKPEVVRFLNEEVIPVWESVRPVPKVTIELGDGRVLHRTLGGNIVTYLLSSDGLVYDAFPGVYTPADYLSELTQAVQVIRKSTPGQDSSHILAWHQKEINDAISEEEMRTTMSKAFIESPLLKALGGNVSTLEKAMKLSPHDPIISIRPDFQTFASRLHDISKQSASVEELRYALLTNSAQSNNASEIGRAAVDTDSRNNIRLMRPAIHLLFARYQKLPNVEECRNVIYEQLLHIPLNDPYLGLASALVPGSHAN